MAAAPVEEPGEISELGLERNVGRTFLTNDPAASNVLAADIVHGNAYTAVYEAIDRLWCDLLS